MNNGKNIGRNRERNSKTNRDDEEKRNIVSELWEEYNQTFEKGVDISKKKIDDDETRRSNSIIDFDSTKLN